MYRGNCRTLQYESTYRAPACSEWFTIFFKYLLTHSLSNAMRVQLHACTFSAQFWNELSVYRRFAGCCWLSTLQIGMLGPWSLIMRGNLTVRKDTGIINSSPEVTMPPIVNAPSSCVSQIRLDGTYNDTLMHECPCISVITCNPSTIELHATNLIIPII